MMAIFGFAVFALIYSGMLKSNARRWRYLARNYATTDHKVGEEKKMQTVVLLGLGAYNTLNGIVTAGVHYNGVSLRIMKPFHFFHEPLFIPYSDVTGWETSWYLNAPSTELQFRQSPDVKMVVSHDLAEWMLKHADQKLNARSAPEGRAGRGWHAFAVANAVLGLFVVTSVVTFVLLQ